MNHIPFSLSQCVALQVQYTLSKLGSLYSYTVCYVMTLFLTVNIEVRSSASRDILFFYTKTCMTCLRFKFE